MTPARSALHAEGATHRGSPFVGRRREIGILTHLIEEGLWGTLRLARVAGEPGIGRRRLIVEALRHGPDAEWVDLAPGGVRADLALWIRTELFDLLDTYPEAPVPSWALHVLARWEPRLHRRAAVPALSREALPGERAAEVVGAAVGATLHALTGRTLVIVNAGLWPREGSALGRALSAMTRSLATPGAVTLAATDDLPGWVDPSGERTLRLEPLRLGEVEELVSAWNRDADPSAFGGWLHRATKGCPFFLHEAVRWLEELGHVRVNDEEGQVLLLDPLARLPLPFNQEAVLNARYERLSPGAARLLHLITLRDGVLETDALRRLSRQEEESFEESLAVLRRREFLLRRSFRRPVASAGVLWKGIVEAAVQRMPRLAHRVSPASRRAVPSPPGSPLAHSLAILARVRAEGQSESSPRIRKSLAAVWRLTRGRIGPAWDGVRGRLAVLAARYQERYGRVASTRLWTQWGLARLASDVHPALRRSLAEIRVGLLEQEGRSEQADLLREETRNEALLAGHLVTAARIAAAEAEAKRRRGNLSEAYLLAETARRELTEMGLRSVAELADYTALRALVDARRLDRAEAEMERRPPVAEGLGEIRERVEELRSVPPLPVPRALDPGSPHPRGWGWGLDGVGPWERARETFVRAAEVVRREGTAAPQRLLTDIAELLESTGLGTARADLEELRLWMDLDAARPPAEVDRRLNAVADLLDRMNPERKRWLADRLRVSRAVGLPAFQSRFRPLLSRPAPRDLESSAPAVTVFLLGLPRVRRSDSVWPMSLWPEWWARLWGEAICRDCLGIPFPRAEAERVLSETGDAPRADLELLLHTADQLLREEHRVAGGLWLHRDQVEVKWSGIDCDLAALFADAAGARRATETHRLAQVADPEAITRPWRRILDRAQGSLLGGMDGAGVEAARVALRHAVTEAVVALRERGFLPSAEERTRWLEGTRRSAEVVAFLAETTARSGRPRAASALQPGSPSTTD